MRTLELNKVQLWMVRPTGTTDVVDGEGNYTGEKTKTYDSPVVINLPLYPSNGLVSREAFGVADLYDMVSVSTDVELEEDDLLFLTTPVSNYDTTYDYYIEKKLVSLNSFSYGLKVRV